MTIFIHGENNYSSLKKLLELKLKFIEKYGDVNISIFEAGNKEEDIGKVVSEIKTPPFLSSKRLIVIKYLQENGDKVDKEKILNILEKLPESSVLIFYEKITPKSDKLFKKLQSTARNYAYPNLVGAPLLSWIKNEVESRGGKIEAEAASKLSFIVGNDAWRLSGEIDKLVNYSHPHAIKSPDIDLLVREKIDAKIFDLVDSLASRDLKSSLVNLHKLIAVGEKDLYILSMINYGFRNLVLVKYLLSKDKGANEREVSQRLGMHPYVAKKTFYQSRSFTLSELKRVYNKLLAIDKGIKTGRKNSLLALDLFIADLCTQ
jgi:DNA polymerase-3 subunit delta